MLIFGGIEDNINSVIWPQISNQLFKITSEGGLGSFQPYQELLWNFTNPLFSNQPLSGLVFSIILTLLKFHGYYLLLLGTAFLNLYFSLKFFKKYQFGWLYALLFSFSTYFWSHIWNHIDLSQIWLIPWVLKDLVDYHEKKEMSLLYAAAVKIIVGVLISNYIGFGLLVTLGLFLLFSLFTKEIDIKKILMLVSVPVVILGLVLLPYVKANLIARKQSTEVPQVGYVVREIGDFVTFSSRPWYYLVPSPTNVVSGDLSAKFYQRLKDTGNYLLDDYFPGEHAANYFGLPLIIFAAYALLRKPQKKHLVELLLIVSLFIFTLPPFFTISGIKIYMPSYLVYMFTPMFRVVSRFSLIILLLVLYIIAENIKIDSKKFKYAFVIFMLFNLVDTFVPFDYVDISKYSSTYDYLRLNTPEQSRFVAYPFSLTKDAYLHLPQHRRLLVNSRNYESADFEGMAFSSKEFTENLLANPDINVLKHYDVEYLVVEKKYGAAFMQESKLDLKQLAESNTQILYEITY
jgi:hypothetical protein